MLSYSQALEIVAGLRCEFTPVRIRLSEGLGRVLARPLSATIPSPPFTNAAMDGFAVRADTVRTGAPLHVAGTAFAGKTSGEADRDPGPQSCIRIMTGAPVPAWANAVIPVENSAPAGTSSVVFMDEVTPGQHIRKLGEDIAEGAVILEQNTRLTPETLMMAAAFGHAEVDVFSQPQVVIVSTGDELRPPGTKLDPGEIFNSSEYFLAAAASSAGLKNVSKLHLADRPAEAEAALANTLDAAQRQNTGVMLITTGAVSAGAKDFVPEVALQLGFEPMFHKVAIRPGKPIFTAKKGRHIWLGLPGNPISTAATWHYFGRPLLASWAGIPVPQKVAMTVTTEVRKPEGLRCFFRARHEGGQVTVLKGQGSAHFRASASANAYVELPESVGVISAGSIVEGLLIN